MNNENLTQFGERLARRMQSAGLKAKNVVEQSDGLITYQNLWIWRHGYCYPRVNSLMKLAEILQTSTDSLLGRAQDE